VNSIYRRVVEELLVEMHLLSVNVDFQYDPIYALGVVSTFDRFMKGYRPERDTASIFEGLCRSTGGDPQQYRQDAEAMLEAARQLSKDDVMAMVKGEESAASENALVSQLHAIASASKFKYSRLFAIGILSALEQVDAALLENDKELAQVLDGVGAMLQVTNDKLKKDLELYRSNLEKMEQAQTVMADILEADRKKRAEREQAKQQPPAEASQETEAKSESSSS
jgi:photosystem II biogenesis protein Psp29